MSKGLKALEVIKNAPTIYVGCASDIYTRHPFECKEIEKELKALEIIKEKVKIEFNDHYLGFEGNYYIIVNNDILNPIKVTKEIFYLLKGVLL